MTLCLVPSKTSQLRRIQRGSDEDLRLLEVAMQALRMHGSSRLTPVDLQKAKVKRAMV